MNEQPETIVWHHLRFKLERQGAYVQKTAGSLLQKGILDLIVVTNRIITVEVKVSGRHKKSERTWKQLGLSGLQDERIRETCARVPRGACCIGGHPELMDGTWGLYVPDPTDPLNRYANYYRIALGIEEVLAWLLT